MAVELDNAAYCEAEVRRGDADRHMTAMMASPSVRRSLMALYAFNLELARIPDTVREPLIGQMRLTWWREAVAECFAGTPRQHAVVQELASAVEGMPEAEALCMTVLEGRELDALAEPPKDRADFERYLQNTAGSLSRLGAMMCRVEDEAQAELASEIAVAYALVGVVRSLPFRRRLHRTLLPADLLAEHGLVDPEGAGFEPSPALCALSSSLLDRADEKLSEARKAKVDKAAVPVLLLGRLAERYSRQLRRVETNPFDPRLATPPAFQALSVGWGAFTGRW